MTLLEANVLAEKIRAAVWEDITSRRGLRQEAEQIDGETLRELFETQQQIVVNELADAGLVEGVEP